MYIYLNWYHYAMFTFRVCLISVTYKRPVLFSGPRNVISSLSEILASQGKCVSWFNGKEKISYVC